MHSPPKRDGELHLTVTNSRGIEQRIHQNELDLRFVGGRLTGDSLTMQHVADDEIVCICGRDHPLGNRRSISTAPLNSETWIVREKGSATRELFEKHLANVGVRLGRVIELDSPEGIKGLVRAGIGTAFLSIHAVTAELRRGELRRIRL